MLDANHVAARLRRSPVADLIRSTRLIAVLRRVEPQARLLERVAELAADGVCVFEITFDAPSAAEDLRACRRLLDGEGQRDAVVGGIDATNARAFLEEECVAVGDGSAIARAEPAEHRALVAAARGLA